MCYCKKLATCLKTSYGSFNNTKGGNTFVFPKLLIFVPDSSIVGRQVLINQDLSLF